MTNEEICREYRLAKNKANQVGIIVDLTGYSRAEVLKILVDGGEAVDKRLYGNNKGAKPPAPKRPDAKKKERTDTVVLSREEADALADFMDCRLQPWIRSQEQDLAQIHLLTGIYLKL